MPLPAPPVQFLLNPKYPAVFPKLRYSLPNPAGHELLPPQSKIPGPRHEPRGVRFPFPSQTFQLANRVGPEDIVAFKDARLAEINPRTGKAVSAKTVND